VSRPLVSVLTTSFNQDRWLEANLLSVQRQTYPNVEHVVNDGGSTDGSVTLLERYARPALRWLSEPDEGQSDALLRAFDRSGGEIVAWLNSDDTFADVRTLEWVVSAFARDPTLDVVYGHVADTTTDDAILRITWCPPTWTRHLGPDVLPLKQPGVFYRRRALVGNFVRRELHFSMDHEFLLRLLNQDRQVGRINQVLATNRHQPDRKSLQRGGQYDQEYAAVRTQGSADLRGRVAHHLVAQSSRVIGIWQFLRLSRRMDPTTPLHVPGIRERLRLQLATRTEREIARREEHGTA